MLAYKLVLWTEVKWHRLQGIILLADVVKDVRFIDGESSTSDFMIAIHHI